MRVGDARRQRARPKPRRTKAIPRNAARRARAPQPPRAVELYYLQALRRVAAAFAQAVGRVLYPRIVEFAKQPAEARTDALNGARVLIAGGPRTGKTTLALSLGSARGISVRHTDDLIVSHGWSEASLEVSRWFDEPGPWIIEGVAVVRALRKWLERNPERERTPGDVLHWLGTPKTARTSGQTTMARGCETVLGGIRHQLEHIGVALKLDADEDDVDEPDVDELAQDMRDAAARSFDEEAFVSSTNTTAARAVAHSKNESKRLGLPKLTEEPAMKSLLDGWRKDNVARIKGMQASQLDKVEAILRRGQGMRAETLARELERQVEDVTRSRAEFIAVDQVLTLNAQVTRARHAAAGIERFVWTTSNDERVRESHDEIDGETFSYDDPPVVDDEPALPGEPPLCRCIPYPLLEELEDEGLE